MRTPDGEMTDVTDVTRHSHIDVLRACARTRAYSAYKEQSVTSVTSVTRDIAALPLPDRPVILALDLGTTTGWALHAGNGPTTSGTASFRPTRYDGGGMRFLRFRNWLEQIHAYAGRIEAIYFEEVRAHAGTDAAHAYGGFLATLTAWCEQQVVPYQGVPVATIKRFITGRGNADKAAVIAAVRARGFKPADDNEADAIAALLWAIDTRGGVK